MQGIIFNSVNVGEREMCFGLITPSSGKQKFNAGNYFNSVRVKERCVLVLSHRHQESTDLTIVAKNRAERFIK